MRLIALHVVFLLSGAAGLGYEIVWTRALSIVLGHEVAAVLAVLSAFFLGFAVGAWGLDRRIGQSVRPGRWYAGLELTIGVWGLVALAGRDAFASALLEVAGTGFEGFGTWIAVFALVTLALAPATIAMGATLPAMDRFLAAEIRRLGREPGRTVAAVYAVNTAGACAGTLGVAFFGLRWFGLAGTLGLLTGMSVVAAVGAAWLAHSVGRGWHLVALDEAVPRTGAVLTILLFFTGLLGIGYQIVGTRALAQVLENTVYTFGAVLSVFLVGTAIGAVLYRAWRGPLRAGPTAAVLLSGLAVASVLGGWALSQSGELYRGAVDVLGSGLLPAVLAEVLVAASVFLVPTLFMGATFSHLAQCARGPVAGVGRAVAWNTLGAAAAGLVFGVLLYPRVGPRGALLGIAAGYWVLAGLAWVARAFLRRMASGASCARVASGASRVRTASRASREAEGPGLVVGHEPVREHADGGTPRLRGAGGSARRMRAPWIAVVFTLLALLLGWRLPSLRLVEPPEGMRFVRHDPGLVSSVSVVESEDGARALMVESRFRMGTTASFFGERRMGHIPLLLHPDPHDALFLGVGTGITLGAAVAHPALEALGVELVPEIVEVLPSFASVNRLDRSTAVRAMVGDARRFVRVASEQYDVIVGDLFHPSRDGAANLYTVEHFRAVEDRLRPDGLFCQWVPLYQVDPPVLRAILRSFLEVFPDAEAYLSHYNTETPALGLVGRPRLSDWVASEPAWDETWWRRRVREPSLAQDLETVDLGSTLSMLGTFVGGHGAMTDLAGEGPLNTDDRPVVLYGAPRRVYRTKVPAHGTLAVLLDELAGPVAAGLLGTERSLSDFGRRLRSYWAARDLYLRSDMRRREGAVEEAIRLCLEAVEQSSDFRVAYTAALSYARVVSAQDPGAAVSILERLDAVAPDRPEAGRILRERFGR